MAQAVLSTVGGAVGTAIGGPIGGFIGQTVGAYLGGYIDRNYLFAQNYERKGPRLEEANIVGGSPGTPIDRIWGRKREAGTMIWATKFLETVKTESQRQEVKGGGGNKTTTTTYEYTCSFAIGLCEGVASGYGRIWADAKLLDQSKYTIRFYKGTSDQLVDSKISAVEGAANAPAFRNTCYIVFDSMLLEQFGNRIPQIEVEVFKPIVGDVDQTSQLIRGVTMLPGSGETVLGTQNYFRDDGYGGTTALNVFNGTNVADAVVSLDQLETVLSNTTAVVIPIEWYADGYDVGSALITPRVNDTLDPTTIATDTQDFEIILDPKEGLAVTNASGGALTVSIYSVVEVSATDGSVTRTETLVDTFAAMADASTEQYVSEAGGTFRITAPGNFDLIQYNGNTSFPNAWVVDGITRFTAIPLSAGAKADGASGTISDATLLEYIAELKARGIAVILRPMISVDASPYTTSDTLYTEADGSLLVTNDATFFFGSDTNDHYRRFILHYANLADDAGGVDGFLIGGNMKGLTHARNNVGAFPFVSGLVTLLGDVRAILPTALLSYAADWQEYGAKWDGVDLYFPMDTLWGDADCDFIGIDWYAPLSDWRDGKTHQDYTGHVDPSTEDVPITSMAELMLMLGNDTDADFKQYFGLTIYHPASGYLLEAANYPAQFNIELYKNNGGSHADLEGCEIGAIRGTGFDAYPEGETDFVATAAVDDFIICEFVNAPGRFFKFQLKNIDTLYQISIGKQCIFISNNAIYVEEVPFYVASVIGCQSTSLANLAYLQCNIESGEGADWEYLTPGHRRLQIRTPITDPDALSKEYLFAPKKLREWWSNDHLPRTAGVEGSATALGAKDKPVWFTAFGVPSVDKGTNQPEASDDHRWNTRALPYFSDGTKDDNIQRLGLQALLDYWQDNTNNPASDQYSGRMIDADKMFAACWDARPTPFFPQRTDIWDDAYAHRLGHWLTGKIGNTPLGLLVQELAGLVGVSVDVTELEAAASDVVGFWSDNLMSPRDMIQVLASAYNFDGYESQGNLKFTHRSVVRAITITEDDLKLTGSRPDFEINRTQEIEIPDEMKITFSNEGDDYLRDEVSERTQAGFSNSIAMVQLPMVLEDSYARAQVGVMIHEAWSGRETAQIGLPLSYLRIDPTDIFQITLNGVDRQYRTERVSRSEGLSLSLVDVDPTVYDLRYAATTLKKTPADNFRPTGRSVFGFMDLPLLTGSEVPYAPRVFAYQAPWPGEVDVYRKIDDNSVFNTSITDLSVVGELTAPLSPGTPDIWDNSNTVSVRMYSGTLQSRTDNEVLSGLNILAVQNTSGDWEVLQFVNATLTAPNEYDLTRLLRGQLGTEGEMRDSVPVGARVVLIDYKAQPQISMSAEERLLEFTYRYGPALQPLNSDAYREVTFKTKGIGLRPLSPVHLIAYQEDGAGGGGPGPGPGPGAGGSSGVVFSWLRRTRIGGDIWDGGDVPLSEASEAYEVDIYDGSTVVRTLTTSVEYALYTIADQTTDFGSPQSSYKVRVFQISAAYGRGQYREETLNV